MPRIAGTEDFMFNHTMIRVKDPEASLKFYQVGSQLWPYDSWGPMIYYSE